MRISNVGLLAEIDGLAQMSCCETEELQVVQHINKIEAENEKMKADLEQSEIEQELINTQMVVSEIQDILGEVSAFVENLDYVSVAGRDKAFERCLEIGNKIRDLDLPEFISK